MFTLNNAKAIIKQILPPVITAAIQRARGVPQSAKFGLAGEKQYPFSKGASIVGQARQHLGQAAIHMLNVLGMPPSKRWTAYLDRMRSDISKLSTIRDVIYYGQSQVGFDHRRPAVAYLPYFQLYEDTIRSEFPHFSNLINEMGDSPYSRSETLLEQRGRLVSNVFYFHLRYVLQCLTLVKEPRTVCEIGGGYGGTGRLFLDNSLHRPDVYVIVDFPECLFFAEVFLRVNFDSLKLLYVTDTAPLEPNVVSEYSAILCPIIFVKALSSLHLDLVINTGSMQEMTEEWVDFWMEWLKKQDCRYFYSLNYFAQPLDNMAEGANVWSPRLTPDWIVRLQRFDPPFTKQQSSRNFAEILAEKPLVKSSINQELLLARYELTKQRILDGQILLEAMDIVRVYPSEDVMWDLLLRCVSEMRTVPKEAYYLAYYLTKHASVAFQAQNGKQLQDLCSQLHLVRSKGREDLH